MYALDGVVREGLFFTSLFPPLFLVSLLFLTKSHLATTLNYITKKNLFNNNNNNNNIRRKREKRKEKTRTGNPSPRIQSFPQLPSPPSLQVHLVIECSSHC